jgi:hypothetical protein
MTAAMRCESCGRDEPASELVRVHRVYITPAAWDTEEHIEVDADVELWCFPCRTSYPHRVEGEEKTEL